MAYHSFKIEIMTSRKFARSSNVYWRPVSALWVVLSYRIIWNENPGGFALVKQLYMCYNPHSCVTCNVTYLNITSERNGFPVVASGRVGWYAGRPCYKTLTYPSCWCQKVLGKPKLCSFFKKSFLHKKLCKLPLISDISSSDLSPYLFSFI